MKDLTYSSKYLEQAVNALSKLPGIGQKTSFRLLMQMLRNKDGLMKEIIESLQNLYLNHKYCKECFTISDNDLCEICSDTKRDKAVICIVEDVNDLMALERTNQFRGRYHVLGGLISPIDGIGPEKLTIEQLEKRIQNQQIEEIIFALPSTVEGDTTSFYIYKKLSGYPIRFTTLAKGIALGNELEYTDELTLARSLINRVDFEIKP